MGFQQKSRLLWCVGDMWTKCGQSVVEVWSLKVLESVEKVDLRGSEEARGPGPLGALGPGPLGAPRASSNSRKSTFSHFPGLLTATERPHSVHIASTPKKSQFFFENLTFLLISRDFFSRVFQFPESFFMSCSGNLRVSGGPRTFG